MFNARPVPGPFLSGSRLAVYFLLQYITIMIRNVAKCFFVFVLFCFVFVFLFFVNFFFLNSLFCEEFIFGGAYYWREF